MEEGKLNIIETGVQPRPLVSITSSLPTISFHDEHGEMFASFEVNKEGKLEVQTKIDFAEAGKDSAKIFWEAFGYYLKEEWNNWVNENNNS